MKKNRGQKSTRSKANKSDYQTAYHRGSNGNHKYICLHCLKSNKGGGKCCGFQQYHLGSNPRAPKRNASKHEWKLFIDRFIHGYSQSPSGQLQKIISLRKEYGLNSINEETLLTKLKAKIDEEIIGAFDVKRHEVVKTDSLFPDLWERKETITKMKEHWGCIDPDNMQKSKQYFVVPTIVTSGFENCIPTSIDNFKVQKGVCLTRPIKYSTKHEKLLSIKTNNSSEIIVFDWEDKYTKYGYRQELYIFETRLQALGFRQDYFTYLFPFIKHLVDYSKDLIEMVNIDYDRVSKKIPEKLV